MRWCRCHPTSVAAAGLPVVQQQQHQWSQLGGWPSDLPPHLQTALPFAPAEQPAPPQELLLLLVFSSNKALLSAEEGEGRGGEGNGKEGGGGPNAGCHMRAHLNMWQSFVGHWSAVWDSS